MRAERKKDRGRLIRAAMGEVKCALTIGNIRYFNVFTGEVYRAEVDILDGYVVRVREEGESSPQQAASYYDGGNRFLIPGFIDTHMHVESTMMIPENLSRAILPWGTTTICTDPHEIANVMGIDGITFMLENAKRSVLRQYVLAPSCVPAVPGLESAGATFEAGDVAKLLDTDDVIGIAEIMDFVGVYRDSRRMHTIINEGIRRSAFLQGHAPYVTGKELAAYRLGGPESDHESYTPEQLLERLRMGIHVNLRASSLVDNLAELVKGFSECQWKDYISICTDDVHAKDLLTTGHINHVIRKAVQSGVDGREAIRFATLNAAREYRFDDLGAVAPGYIADIQLVDELDGRQPAAVFTNGILIAENGKYLGDDRMENELKFKNTVNTPQIRTSSDFLLKVPSSHKESTVSMKILKPLKQSRHLMETRVIELPVKNGTVDISAYPQLQFVTVINRYGTGGQTTAVCENFGISRGALATTVSHDSHNLTVAYRDAESAFLAAETLRKTGGGICVADRGEITYISLPVAGLMSHEPCDKVAAQIEAVQVALDRISNDSVRLTDTSVISLPVQPGVIITDMGLVDGLMQKFFSQFDID